MNVTYWFGAGASAQALPTINSFIDHVAKCREQTISILSKSEFKKAAQEKNINYNLGEEISNKCFDPLLNYLAESESFGTIDTLAKFYMALDGDKFTHIKNLLKSYFLLEDYFFNKIDSRYLGLLTTLSNNLSLGNNVNFITWNYDNQLYKTKKILNNKPFTLPDFIDEMQQFQDQGSVAYHLNGHSHNANIYRGYRGLNQFDYNWACSVIDIIIKQISAGEASLRFAFEENNVVTNRMLQHLQGRIAHTNILVIIGYSFPFFNKEIDTTIIGFMKNLSRVYVQDVNPAPIIEKIRPILAKSRDIFFGPNVPNNIYSIEAGSKSAFYIPYDFKLS